MPYALTGQLIFRFIGAFTLQYLARTQWLPFGIRCLKEEVEKDFLDEKGRLEWHRRKAAELDAAMADNITRE